MIWFILGLTFTLIFFNYYLTSLTLHLLTYFYTFNTCSLNLTPLTFLHQTFHIEHNLSIIYVINFHIEHKTSDVALSLNFICKSLFSCIYARAWLSWTEHWRCALFYYLNICWWICVMKGCTFQFYFSTGCSEGEGRKTCRNTKRST